MIGIPPFALKEEYVKPMSNKVGLDIGTMWLVSAKLNDNNIDTSKLRNVFLRIDKDSIGNMDLSNVSHTIIDNDIFIISDDAYNFANVFNKNLLRPMSKGMISSVEIDAVDILASMVHSLIGKNDLKNSKCVYSVPANPIDADMNIIYHQNVFGRIVHELGYEAEPLDEATAVIYSECESSNFSGIAISFGAGMTNVAVVYKSIPVITFSVARGGDYIDNNAAISTGTIANRVTLVKEKDFSLTNIAVNSKNKKEKRIKEALLYYYVDLVDYVTKNLILKLKELNTDLPESLPLIVSGGTSLCTNFIEFFRSRLEDYELPIDISEVRHATDPLTAVATGCLIKALR